MMKNDWDMLVSLLPDSWHDTATNTGALKGLRKDKSPANLLRTLLIHIGCGYSLRETSVRARRADIANLSDVALLKRLRKSKDWLQSLCVDLFNERGVCVGRPRNQQFRLFDATNVKEPGQTGSLWRIHYSIQIPSLECDHFSITSTKGGGTAESLEQFPIHPGDRIIADRGYSRASDIHHAASQGAIVCIRLNHHSVTFEDHAGNRFDLFNEIQKLRRFGDIGEWVAMLPAPGGNKLPVRICAIRKSRQAIQLAHRKLRRNASKKGYKLKPDTLVWGKYVTVVTTFPQLSFSAAEILEWYRLRWQVELVFKRFKQIAQLGHLPKHDEESSKAWLYGKLLAALLAEKIIAYGETFSPWGYEVTGIVPAEPLA